MESYYKDECLPFSSILLEGFNELYHLFDKLFQSLASIFLEVFYEMFHGFDEQSHALLLLSLKLEILKLA